MTSSACTARRGSSSPRDWTSKVPTAKDPHALSLAQRQRLYDINRRNPESKRLYHSQAWVLLSKLILAKRPLCEPCLVRGVCTPSRHVHHVLSLVERPDLALDEDNLQACCLACHNRETHGSGTE
jgi:5-methylcytosine-specific restriction endonuclease McrA